MNDELNQTRDIATSALFLALALALPVVFHLVGLGRVFLPMLLPILLAGFILPWQLAALTGFLAPLLSALLTGMPPLAPPIAPMMMVELTILGAAPAIVYRSWKLGLWPALIAGIVLSRIVNFGMHICMAEFFHIHGITWGLINLISGIPGLVLQLVTIPVVIHLLEKRYPALNPKFDPTGSQPVIEETK